MTCDVTIEGAVQAPGAPAPVRCRAMTAADADAVVGLLRRGFPERSEAYWRTGVDRLLAQAAARAARPGFVLDCAGVLVGVLLLIPGGTAAAPRMNVSSWYVDPRFAAYGALLSMQAVRRKTETYVNISPAPHTRATIEAQGFRRYSQGRLLAAPALMRPRRGVRVRAYDPVAHAALPAEERALIERHVGYGCLALVAETPAGLEPVLVMPWRIRHRIPGAQLVWCHDFTRFAALAGPVGRALLRRGLLLLLVDACDAAEGLLARRIAERCPAYARGPAVPRTGDLTDTEFVMFGP